jgi:SAM-dependent methyltransferase
MVYFSKLVKVGQFDSETSLNEDLALLARAFGVDEVRPSTLDDPGANPTGYFASIQDYYTSTDTQLTGVHSPDGAIHFGLDWDGRFHHYGFFEQPRMVEDIIRKTGARDVLEVGFGKGTNTVYLAQRNPEVRFTGIDFTPLHVRQASKRGEGLRNLHFVECDFHRMIQEDDSFDLVFDVEALCYSDTPKKLDSFFSELRRVLRPRGLFVSFDYLRPSGFAGLGSKARLATELVERAWVIDRFHLESSWDEAARRVGFVSKGRRDLRAAALPSVERLYRQARMFYLSMASPAKPLIEKLIRRSTHNAVSAMMLPYAFGLRSMEYRLTTMAQHDEA